MKTDIPNITIYDGKYTLIFEPTNMRALRYGEKWRDIIGDGFIMALGQEILDMASVIKGLMEIAEQAMPDTYFASDGCTQAARKILGHIT